MPREPDEPTLYVADPSTGTSDLIERLARDLPAVVEPAREERRTYLDTFDRLVRDAGYVLDATPSPRGGVALTLRPIGEGFPLPPVPAPAPPVTAADLPPGRAGDIVRKAIGVRVLRPVATVRVVVHPLTVRNADDKATAKVVVEEVTGQHRRIGRWLRLVPVRGYDKAAARVRDELEAANATVGDDVLDALAKSGIAAAEAPPSLITVTPDQTAAAAVVSVLLALLEVIEANVDGTVDDIDPEFLHDYRVAVRRTRSVLKHAKGVLPDDLLDCFAPEFRWIQEQTGPARDLDVMDIWLAEEAANNGLELGPVRDLVVRRRREAHHDMVDAITSERARALLADWRSTLDHLEESAGDPTANGAEAGEWGEWPKDAGEPLIEMVEHEIERFQSRVHKLGAKIDDESAPEDLHDLRKRGKELRYLFELFGSALPAKKVGPFVKDLKGLQEVLGTFQDTAVQADELRELGEQLAAEGAPPNALDAVEELIARTLERQVDARRSFADRYRRFAANEW